MFLLDPPHETRTGPVDDGFHLHFRVMNDVHFLPGPSNEVYQFTRPSPERMSGLCGRREPKEVSRLDLLFFGLGLPVFIEDDANTLSCFDDVEPFVLIAVPVRNRADIVWGDGVNVDADLGQAAPVAEV